MKKTLISFTQGFTIVELLVVVAIIALLTGIVTSNLSPAKARARDTKRISDLGQIQLALELYFDRCKQYPPLDAEEFTNAKYHDVHEGCPTDIRFASFMSQIPSPPKGSTYLYAAGPDPDKPDQFVLHTTLEYPSEVLKDSLTETTKAEQFGFATFSCYIPNTNSLDYCLASEN